MCSLIYLRYTPEIYKTSANIQIAIKDQPLEFMGMNNYSSNTNLSSELAIIKSQNSIFKLIKHIKINIIFIAFIIRIKMSTNNAQKDSLKCE